MPQPTCVKKSISNLLLLIKMRAVCFVNRLEFEFKGNVFPNAMALGDVDNDGNSELGVGNINGEITIYKEDKSWQSINNLGMITAICIGDIFNCGQNSLIVVSGDGWCNILYKSCNSEDSVGKLEVIHVQRIPANTKVALLGDIDGDGRNELVLGLTDRVVRSYRWVSDSPESSLKGRLICLNKWECANQIGSVTLHHSANNLPCLLIAQPGGTFMKIRCHPPEDESTLPTTSVDFHPLSCHRMRNANVSTEIVGDIAPPTEDDQNGMRYAVATLDGTLMLVHEEDILWSIQVDHQLFALTKLMMADNEGKEGIKIVACSWDGQTYILDQGKRSVRFHLEESVCGFSSGYYSLELGKPPTPCLVYTTFTNKIYVYYDVKVPDMVTQKCQPTVDVGFDTTTEEGRRKMQALMEYCLYGSH